MNGLRIPGAEAWLRAIFFKHLEEGIAKVDGARAAFEALAEPVETRDLYAQTNAPWAEMREGAIQLAERCRDHDRILAAGLRPGDPVFDAADAQLEASVRRSSKAVTPFEKVLYPVSARAEA